MDTGLGRAGAGLGGGGRFGAGFGLSSLLWPSTSEREAKDNKPQIIQKLRSALVRRASPRWMEYNVHIRQWSFNNRVCKQPGQRSEL